MVESFKNIILIGYRATGKTSVGRQLAQDLGLNFVDLDEEIARETGMTIEKLVAQSGWGRFRELERQTLVAISKKTDQVIATGGGAVLHQDIWSQVRQGNLVVWLQADVATIIARMQGDSKSAEQRPSLTGQEIAEEVSEVLAQRLPLYAKSSDVQLSTAQPLAQICVEIKGALKN